MATGTVKSLVSTLNSKITNYEYYSANIQTPSDHYNYVDINKTQSGKTYSNIIVSCATNAAILLCAYPFNSSTFRVIARNADGSSATSSISINCILT